MISRSLRFHLGNIVGFLLYTFLARRCFINKLNNKKVLSIYFHNPSVKVFEFLVRSLIVNKFTIVSITELQKFLSYGETETSRTAFISFDDAWAGNLKLIPVLEKYNIPITLFAATKSIEDGELWLSVVRRAFPKISKEIRKELKPRDLKNLPFKSCEQLYQAAKMQIKIKRSIMTREQLIAFSKYVSFGSHTVNHPILPNCSKDQVNLELKESEKKKKKWGLTVNHCLAYPNGTYCSKTIDIIKNSTYKYAFTTEAKLIDLSKKYSSYKLPRTCIPDQMGNYENLARMMTFFPRRKFLR